MNIDALKKRAQIIKILRDFFHGLGFMETDTPVRIHAPAPECHIDCPEVASGGFLRASPELQMKKLLAEGLDKIFQIGPCFRDGEIGSRHRPEFTMIEWYRKGGDYLDIKKDMVDLLGRLFSEVAGREMPQNRVITVRQAYKQWAGWDPWQNWNQDRFDFDMAVKIEPALKDLGHGVFLIDYPVQAASLSLVSGDSAERWEYYWNGIELANCFSELCDSDEQQRRFLQAKEERRKLNEADYPIDGQFIDSLSKIHSAAGVALGVDRLVMALTDLEDISSVVFPE